MQATFLKIRMRMFRHASQMWSWREQQEFMEALGHINSAPGPSTHSLGAASIYQSTGFRKEMNLRSISDWNCRGPLVDRMQLLLLHCSQSQDSHGHADSHVFSLTPSPAQLTAVLPFGLQETCAFPAAFPLNNSLQLNNAEPMIFPGLLSHSGSCKQSRRHNLHD